MINKYIIFVDCNICGEEFEVEIENGKIITECFHSKLDMNYFDGWTYSYKDNDIFNENKKIINFKNKFYKIIGFCKISREIFYYLYMFFHRKKIFEIWECKNCSQRDD